MDSANKRSGVKRKHRSLSIAEKVELLKRLDSGVSVRSVCEMYGIGSSTVYDIKKQKERVLKFFTDSVSKKQMFVRKSVTEGKSSELDQVLITWFNLRVSEGVEISGNLLKEQAKVFHEELGLTYKCDYTEGWLQRFKSRHGLTFRGVCSKKRSADTEASTAYVDKFAKLDSDENLSSDQVYIADETAFFRRCTPKRTLTTEDAEWLSGFKASKDHVTRKKRWGKVRITESEAEDTSELEETSESEAEQPWLQEGEEEEDSELEGDLTVFNIQLDPEPAAEVKPPDDSDTELKAHLSSESPDNSEERIEEAQVTEIKQENGSWDFMEFKEEPLEDEFRGKKWPAEGTRLRPEAKKSRDVEILVEDGNNIDKTLVVLDWYRSDISLVINQEDRLSAYPLTGKNLGKVWHGARATYGYTKGKVFYEVKVMHQLNATHPKAGEQLAVIRIGWSFDERDMIGGYPVSYCSRGKAKVSGSRKSKVQGFYKDFGEDNVVGCFLDLDVQPAVLSFTLNGEYQGIAYEIPHSRIRGAAMYPHIITRNCPYKVNFGRKNSWFEPLTGYIAAQKMPLEDRIRATRGTKIHQDFEIEDSQAPFLGYGPGSPETTEHDVIPDPSWELVPTTTVIPVPTETSTSVKSNSVKYLQGINFSQLTLKEKTDIRSNGKPTPDLSMQRCSDNWNKECSHQFSSDLYKKYEWLCGCDEVMALFCFPCLLFGGDLLWTKSGVMDFGYLVQKIKKHELSVKHVNNVIDLSLLGKDNTPQVDITYKLLATEHNKLVRRNREVLSRIIDCMKFCGKFKLPIRVHDEAINFKNPSVFQGLLNFVCKLDCGLDAHLNTAAVFKGNTKSIQNQLLESMFEIYQEKIVKEVRNTEYLAVMCDEISDIYDRIYMIIVIRYELEGKPVERFWGVFNPVNQTEESIASVLQKELHTLIGDSPHKLVAQTYDGTGVQRWSSKGVQARIKRVYSNAHYVHCYTHQLNLILEKAVSQNRSVRMFFNRLSGISGFFSECPQRMTTLENFAQRRMAKPSAVYDLKRRTVSAIHEMKDVLIECCIALELSNSRDTGFAAAGIKAILNDPEFEFWLEFFSKMMPHVDMLSTQLRSENSIDAAEISDSLSVFDSAVQKLRDECDAMMMSPEQKRRNFYADKVATAKEVCDVIMLQCRERLSFDYHLQADKLFCVTNFSQYAKEFPCNELAQAVAAYPVLEIFKLKTELSVLYSRDLFKPGSLIGLFKVIVDNHLLSAFSETVQLLKILITTPMITAETERCFSTMKRIKSYLCSNMLNDNLSALTMISMEENIAEVDFNEEIINHFASKSQCIDFNYR